MTINCRCLFGYESSNGRVQKPGCCLDDSYLHPDYLSSQMRDPDEAFKAWVRFGLPVHNKLLLSILAARSAVFDHLLFPHNAITYFGPKQTFCKMPKLDLLCWMFKTD